MDYQENIEKKKFLKEIERSYFEMYKPFNLSPNSTDGSCTLCKMYLMIIYERHMHTYHTLIIRSTRFAILLSWLSGLGLLSADGVENIILQLTESIII